MAKKPIAVSDEDSGNGPVHKNRMPVDEDTHVDFRVTRSGRIRFNASPEATRRVLKWVVWICTGIGTILAAYFGSQVIP